jgi:uncharacterized OB-fold protein
MIEPAQSQRPLPRPTPISQPFWDACRDGRLIVQRCPDCQRYVFTPQAYCRYCHNLNLQWVDSAGVGTVITYTIVHRPPTPAFEVPYVIAIVRLDEGYEMMTNIVDSPPESVRIGDRVQLTLMAISDEITLPCFRPLVDGPSGPDLA